MNICSARIQTNSQVKILISKSALSHCDDLAFLYDIKNEIGMGDTIELILLVMEGHYSHTTILMYTSNNLANSAEMQRVAIVETTGIMQVLIYEDIHLTTAHPDV